MPYFPSVRHVGCPEVVDMLGMDRVDEALLHVNGMFLEMPRTTWTVDDACAITTLDRATCVALLLALERARFLRRTTAGQFALNGESDEADGAAGWVG